MGIGRFVEYKETRPLSFPVKYGWITPRWWSGLIQSLALFLLLLSCCKYSEFFRKKVQFFTVQVSHSYQKGVAFVGMRHLFGCFSIKKLLFLWYFTKWWLCSIRVILCCICRVEVSPFCRRTVFFCLEDSVKMSATRESTLGRNDVVAIIRTFQHHLFGSVETYLTEPYSEVRVQALVEKQAQFVLWYIKCTRKRQYVHITILIT